MKDDNLSRALDRVDFLRERVQRTKFKNARIVRMWNLFAAEDIAQHIAEALQQEQMTNDR